jgi:hypothetical protein
MNFLSRLLRDVKGVGCKIDKVWTRGGYGWRIIVDGKSTDELPPDGSSPFATNLDLSFRPTQMTATTFDITQGNVYMGEEDPEVLPATATDISFANDTHFQVKIDISSVAPVATWEAGVAFTANTATALYFPVLEFGTAGDFSTLIRRQTSDIHYHVGEGGFDIRGTEELFKAVTDRAYLTADDSLVAHGTAFDSETMYLYPTWDWIRWPAPEGS